MAGLGVAVLVLLALVGLIAGVGITALGPGGVLVTIGLFAFTGLAPATVAGTAIVTHIATGLLGTAAYLRSGQLTEPLTRRTALVLCVAAVAGTPLGVWVNSGISGRAFGVSLGIFVAVVAALVWLRESRPGRGAEDAHPRHSLALLSGLGFAVAVVSGVFGVGGPLLAVPLLLVLGVPVLSALGAAQVQSVIIASVGTVGYLAYGAISWPLAALVGIPELCGVLIGWRLAHTVPTPRLKYALVVVLFALAPYLAFRG